jgi:hypothetical protein
LRQPHAGTPPRAGPLWTTGNFARQRCVGYTGHERLIGKSILKGIEWITHVGPADCDDNLIAAYESFRKKPLTSPTLSLSTSSASHDVPAS